MFDFCMDSVATRTAVYADGTTYSAEVVFIHRRTGEITAFVKCRPGYDGVWTITEIDWSDGWAERLWLEPGTAVVWRRLMRAPVPAVRPAQDDCGESAAALAAFVAAGR